MGEYNKLTERLLSQGYTAEHYPKDMVRIASGCYKLHMVGRLARGGRTDAGIQLVWRQTDKDKDRMHCLRADNHQGGKV